MSRAMTILRNLYSAASRPAACLAAVCACVMAAAQDVPEEIPVSPGQYDSPAVIVNDEFTTASGRPITISADSLPVLPPYVPFQDYDVWVQRDDNFVPDPTRAVWMSALCPGLGQVYNRRYWKLPIVVGGYLGLAYATSWNNTLLTDYTNAYRDIMDSDPTTNSYMNFFPPTVHEEDLDKTWLTNILQSRKNYFRRNRDLCIICMVGVYLLAMVDAYVDASLAHFDITPDLSIDVAPSIMRDTRNSKPSFGIQWAMTF